MRISWPEYADYKSQKMRISWPEYADYKSVAYFFVLILDETLIIYVK